MKREIFRGAGVALVTPMNPDNSINWDKLAELIEFQVENYFFLRGKKINLVALNTPAPKLWSLNITSL